MTTTSEPSLQQNGHEDQVAVPALSDLVELGLKVKLPNLSEEPAVPEAAEEIREEALPSPSDAAAGEAYLIIQPHTDPFLVFRFCQSVREIGGVDIAFLTTSPKGIVIKLVLRESGPILPLLLRVTEMEEVEEISHERALAEESDWSLPPFLKLNAEKALAVTLRAP